ncbi:Acetylornithine aminotransferase, mitochondrial [Smittium culicis]|uniref:acetylornithine transaminase n=1 Tax=Smittium culicis TaxID=133412 RepID=A0A1R1XV23_9FUNG|nr:Acetylornithine aminotransferase, mitochondrial [Smittium culicis]OMJ23510.1 Acetylornithine aminotransferase, mitochondrial [Smittium culicis]
MILGLLAKRCSGVAYNGAAVKARLTGTQLSLNTRSIRNFHDSDKQSLSMAKELKQDSVSGPIKDQAESKVSDQVAEYSKYMMNTYTRPPMLVDHGKGCYVYDTNGNKYLDMTAGIAVLALGHGHEGVSKVLYEQSKNLNHVSNLFFTKEVCELAKDVIEKTMSSYKEGNAGIYENRNASFPKIFFTNSGTEATEGALKFARKYGKHIASSGTMKVGNSDPTLASDPNLKYHFHCFTGSFHGRSTGALAVTSNPKYQTPFTPLIPGVTVSKFNETRELSSFINERTCGVIVEPIQGEGGITEATEEFLKAVRKRCDQVGAVLIYDEIQCGLGRTGKLWGHNNYSPECSPDIITLAKPLANGFPIGAIIVSDKVSQVIKVGDHGSTFGGNPLGCAVGKYVFAQISDNAFLSQVQEKGEYFKQELQKAIEPYMAKGSSNGAIVEVRGKGLMLGVEFKEAPSSIVDQALTNGLLLVAAGRNTIRFLPPLIIEKNEIDTCIQLFKKTLSETL